MLAAPGCFVETAECDQTTRCDDEDAQICFEFACRDRCESDEECDPGQRCVSCSANDSCFGEQARACVDPDVLS